jgi:hypothetical protein
VLYGYDPVISVAPMLPDTENKLVQELLTKRNTHVELIKTHLVAAQNRMKAQANKHCTNKEFQVGERVLLKLQPYAQTSMANRLFPKLSYKFFDPFTARVGKAAYKLELPANSLIHLVFHVSQLKQFNPDYTLVFSKLPVLDYFSAKQLMPKAILERRLVKKGNAAVPQVKVKWQALPEVSVMWEDWYVLINRFPVVKSWGQDCSSVGGPVTPVIEAEASA